VIVEVSSSQGGLIGDVIGSVIGEEAGVMTKFLVLFLIGLVGIVTYRTLSGKSKRPDEESAPWDEPPPDLMSDDVSPQMLDLTFPVAASPVIDAGISTSTVASTDPSGLRTVDSLVIFSVFCRRGIADSRFGRVAKRWYYFEFCT
jgi:hypothetical protein